MRILRFTIFIAAAVFTFNALFTFNGTAADTAESSEADAAESSEADASMRCCRERLSDDEKLLYDALVTCALSESPDEETDHITVSLDPAGDEFQAMLRKVYNAVIFDHPEFFWLSMSSSALRYQYHSALFDRDSYKVSFSLSEEFPDRHAQMEALEAAADDILSRVDLSAPDEEVALAIHDELIALVSYDLDAVSSNEKDLAHTAYGALVENSRGEANRAVCDGYSYAYEYLLQKAGIRSTLLSGRAGDSEETAGKHSWNLVNLGGDWYEVDATWDDISVEELDTEENYSEIAEEALNNEWYMDKLKHYRFNVTTEEMAYFEPDEYYRYSNDRGWVSFLTSSVHIRHTEDDSEETGDYMTPLAPVAEGTEFSYEALRDR
jgi:hypothetical protein